MPQIVRTRGGSVASFFERYLRHSKGASAGRPFQLEPWQLEFVNDFYRVDDDGRRIFRLGILGIPRGNGKSPMAAGFGLYELVANKDAPDVFCAAASREQAQVVMDFSRSFVDGGPLRKQGVVASRRSITFDRHNGVFRVLSSAGSLQHGLNPSAFIGDELHAFVQASQEEVWTALETALHKRPNSYGLVITTAGFDKQTLLGRMYDDCLGFSEGEDRPGLRIRRDVENGTLFYWYGIPEAEEDNWLDEELWRAVNPASWVDLADLRKQLHSPGVDEYKFKRLHLNMWTAARDVWLPAGSWAKLAEGSAPASWREYDPDIPDGSDVWVGVDVGWVHDSTAVTWAHRRGDGRIAIRAQVWTTDPAAKGEYVPGGKMRLELVEAMLRELGRRYRVREVAYDPKYFGRSAELLSDEGLGVMVEMLPSSAPMQTAWQSFYQAVVEGSIVHNGDRTLAAHVEAAAADKTEYGWKVRKLRSSSRIDALAAAVMAHGRCQLNESDEADPQIYWLDI